MNVQSNERNMCVYEIMNTMVHKIMYCSMEVKWWSVWYTPRKAVLMLFGWQAPLYCNQTPNGGGVDGGPTHGLLSKVKCKVYPCTGTEALYRPYSP